MFHRWIEAQRIRRWMLDGILRHARREAKRLHHEYVDCYHILLGVCASADDVVSEYGLSLDATRLAVESEVRLGPHPVTIWQKVSISPRAGKVIEGALQQASRSEHHVVLPEHVVVALLSVDDAVTSRVLHRLGFDAASLHATLMHALRSTEAEAGLRRDALRRAPWVRVAVVHLVISVLTAVIAGILVHSWGVSFAVFCGMFLQSVFCLRAYDFPAFVR